MVFLLLFVKKIFRIYAKYSKIIIIFAAINGGLIMKKATVKIIEQSDKVGLYSICFDSSDLSEYEKFV